MTIASAQPYRKESPDKDAELREKLRQIWCPNMGYRVAHDRVKPHFEPINLKRVHRVWKEEKLGRKKRSCKKRSGASVPFSADHPNRVWGVDFVIDACLNGTRLKILVVKDEFTKECLALEVSPRLRSSKVRRVLKACFDKYGIPEKLRSDNGSEFIARTLAIFLIQSGTEAHFNKPGSPRQNAFAESFNSTFRAECLDVEVLHNLADAQMKLAVYRRWYNEERSHSTIGRISPTTFSNPNIATTQTTGEKL